MDDFSSHKKELILTNISDFAVGFLRSYEFATELEAGGAEDLLAVIEETLHSHQDILSPFFNLD